MAAKHILAIDQGTTSTRAIVFDAAGRPAASAQKELPQIFPRPGWVEHDPEEIWRATVEVCRGALADTLERARHYGAMARDALGLFPDKPLKAALLEAVDFAIDRAH